MTVGGAATLHPAVGLGGGMRRLARYILLGLYSSVRQRTMTPPADHHPISLIGTFSLPVGFENLLRFKPFLSSHGNMLGKLRGVPRARMRRAPTAHARNEYSRKQTQKFQFGKQKFTILPCGTVAASIHPTRTLLPNILPGRGHNPIRIPGRSPPP
jgi:hypothetical protein